MKKIIITNAKIAILIQYEEIEGFVVEMYFSIEVNLAKISFFVSNVKVLVVFIILFLEIITRLI